MSKIKFKKLTTESWNDFQKLFGSNGACGGCWCMWWKLARKDFEANKGDGNKILQKKTVNSGNVPGIMAYVDDEPVGWCAIEPRSAYPKLGSSRILKPVDDKPVWSIVCFFVARKFRKQGLSVKLLKEAVKYASKNGAVIVEGYPVETEDIKPDAFIYHGIASAFLKAGFKEVARRSETRPIMRIAVR